MPANAPAGTNVSTYWDTNTVWMPLKDGTTVRTTDFTGVLNPFRTSGGRAFSSGARMLRCLR